MNNSSNPSSIGSHLPSNEENRSLSGSISDTDMTDTEEESSVSPHSSSSRATSSWNGSLNPDGDQQPNDDDDNDYTDSHGEEDTIPGLLDVSQPPALPRFSVLKTTVSAPKFPNGIDPLGGNRGKVPQKKSKRRGVTFSTNLTRERQFYTTDPAAKCSIYAGDPGLPPPDTYLGVPIEVGDTVYEPPVQIHITRTSSQLSKSHIITSSLAHAESSVGPDGLPGDNNNMGWESWCEPALIETPVNPCYRYFLRKKIPRHQELIHHLGVDGLDPRQSIDRDQSDCTPQEKALIAFINQLEPLKDSFKGGGVGSGSIGIGAYRLLKSVPKSQQGLLTQKEHDDLVVINDLAPFTWSSNLLQQFLKQTTNPKPISSLEDGGSMYLTSFPVLEQYSPLPSFSSITETHKGDGPGLTKALLSISSSSASASDSSSTSVNINTSPHYPLSYNNFLLNLHRLPIAPVSRGHPITPCYLLEEHRITQTISIGINSNTNPMVPSHTTTPQKVILHTKTSPSVTHLQNQLYQNYTTLKSLLQIISLPKLTKSVFYRFYRHHLMVCACAYSQSPLSTSLTPPLLLPPTPTPPSSFPSPSSPSPRGSLPLAKSLPLDYIPQIIAYLQQHAPTIISNIMHLGDIYFSDISRINGSPFSSSLYDISSKSGSTSTSTGATATITGDNLSSTACHLQFGLVEYPLAKLLPKTQYFDGGNDGDDPQDDVDATDDLFADGLHVSGEASPFYSGYYGDEASDVASFIDSGTDAEDSDMGSGAGSAMGGLFDLFDFGNTSMIRSEHRSSIPTKDTTTTADGEVEEVSPSSTLSSSPPPSVPLSSSSPSSSPTASALAKTLSSSPSILDDLLGELATTPSLPDIKPPSSFPTTPASRLAGSRASSAPTTPLVRSFSASSVSGSTMPSLWDDSLSLASYDLPRSRSSLSFGSSSGGSGAAVTASTLDFRPSTPGIGARHKTMSTITTPSFASLATSPSLPSLGDVMLKPPQPTTDHSHLGLKRARLPSQQLSGHDGLQPAIDHVLKKQRFGVNPPPPPPPPPPSK